MNGKAWRISIIVAMLEYGENAVGGSDVIHIARAIFPRAHPWYDQAEFELSEFRKHLAFMKDGGEPPSLQKQLKWTLSSGVRAWHTVPKDFRNFLNSHPCRHPYLREMADGRRKPNAPEPRPTSGEDRRISAK